MWQTMHVLVAMRFFSAKTCLIGWPLGRSSWSVQALAYGCVVGGTPGRDAG
jgi:hypothetical protein